MNESEIEEWIVICAVVSLLIVFVVRFSFWLMIFMFVYFHHSCWLYCDLCVLRYFFFLLKICWRLHVLFSNGIMKCYGANDGIILVTTNVVTDAFNEGRRFVDVLLLFSVSFCLPFFDLVDFWWKTIFHDWMEAWMRCWGECLLLLLLLLLMLVWFTRSILAFRNCLLDWAIVAHYKDNSQWWNVLWCYHLYLVEMAVVQTHKPIYLFNEVNTMPLWQS